MDVVAEGIETESQVAQLQALAASYVRAIFSPNPRPTISAMLVN